MTAQAPAISARIITTSEANADIDEVIDCRVYPCYFIGSHYIEGILGDGSAVVKLPVCGSHAKDISAYPKYFRVNEEGFIVKQ